MDILSEIIAHKKTELPARYALQQESLEKARVAKPRPSFKEALLREGPSVIAEVKKASPSAGIICEDFHPIDIAKGYVEKGARAISVLTDEKYFKGHLDYLEAIANAVDIPLLRKEFIIDDVQIIEAKAAGASAYLLIAAVLEPAELEELIIAGREWGLDALVEIHNQEELEKVRQTSAEIVGVNNRNLRTFETSLDVSRQLIAPMRDTNIQVTISESGIKSNADIRDLHDKWGYDAFLIGESLMKEAFDLKDL